MQTTIEELDDRQATMSSILSTRGKTLPIYRVKLVRERREQYDPGVDMTVRSPANVVQIARALLEDQSHECLIALLLDVKNKVRGIHIVSTGILDQSLMHPREVFQAAILANSSSVVLVHNHPSGDPTPSKPDRRITQRIDEAGKLLGIDLLDHVVIGHDDRFVSLKERGVF